jgi:hypothetical protein
MVQNSHNSADDRVADRARTLNSAKVLHVAVVWKDTRLVLKTAERRKALRGFKSHPRRSIKPKPAWGSGFDVQPTPFHATPAFRSRPLKSA